MYTLYSRKIWQGIKFGSLAEGWEISGLPTLYIVLILILCDVMYVAPEFHYYTIMLLMTLQVGSDEVAISIPQLLLKIGREEGIKG